LQDPNRLEDVDMRFACGEERVQVIGIANRRILFVVVTMRDGMSKTAITRVTLRVGEPLPKGATDWQRLDTMSDEQVRTAALSDPDARPASAGQLANMRRVSRVKVLRQRLGMTQSEFARVFRLPITTLRDWEQRRSTPDAPARALLLAIERDPDAMRRLLADEAA
jgi:putative transcriptional regulator